jgi:hypothetical protein
MAQERRKKEMSPAITLALLSANLVGLACSGYFARQAATYAIMIRTGFAQGVRLSKQHRLLLLNGVWIAPVMMQLGLSMMLIWFNLQIAAHTAFEGLHFLAYMNVFFWSIALVGTLGYGPIVALAIRAEVRGDTDAPNDSAT